MKKHFYLLVTLITFFASAAFTSPRVTTKNITWSVDATHSTISFTVRHFFTPVQGAFNDFEGTVLFDPESPGEGSAEFTIDVASIDTKNDRRNNHLKSPDFFNAEEHPKITFKSSKFVGEGDNKFTVVGDLTMRGTTKEVEIAAEFLGSMDNPRKEGAVIGGMKGETTIKRSDFGIGAGNFAATTTIGDEVEISVFLEMSGEK